MKKLPDLAKLSSEAKNALIVELWEELTKLKDKPEKHRRIRACHQQKDLRQRHKRKATRLVCFPVDSYCPEPSGILIPSRMSNYLERSHSTISSPSSNAITD
jgi:uncharacterized protein (DUF2344 family)